MPKFLTLGWRNCERDRPGSHGTAALQDVATVSIDPEPLTRPGIAMGTVAYMSPEQARGEEVDGRADLFAFGAVLYEMATGRRAFAGATTAMVFDALLNREPHRASGLNPQLPAKLEKILQKALRKDIQQRYQSAASMLTGLKELKRELETGHTYWLTLPKRLPAVHLNSSIPSESCRLITPVTTRTWSI